MTVNPNPLSRAQWLFSTSSFFWISTDEPSHGFIALWWPMAPCFVPPRPWTNNKPWWDLPMSTSPALGTSSWTQICSWAEMLPQPKEHHHSEHWGHERGEKVLLWFGNTPHLVQVWSGDDCVPIYKHCRNFIWREPARTGFSLTAKDLFGFLCWKLCFSRGVGWGEPDGPMNIVVMDKSRGGTVKPAECKQPPTPRWQHSLKYSACVASPVLRQSARGLARPPLTLMCRIPSISAARFSPRSPKMESLFSHVQSISQWQSH